MAEPPPPPPSLRPPGEMEEEPPLVLHMDINKTLIICDPVSGVDTQAMVNSLLSECTWGIIAATDGGPSSPLTPRSWRLLSTEPSSTPAPELVAVHGPGAIMTYNEFLEGHLKPDKASKRRLKGRFTEPGEVGEAIRPHFHRLLAALQIPEAQREAAAHALPQQLGTGQYHILPSFFRLVNALEERDRDFALVFRTFGVDTTNVAAEWNLFCDNQHPLFAPTRPERTKARRLELPRDSGALHRTGSTTGVGGAGNNGSDGDGVHLAMVDPTTQLVALAHGLPAVYARIMDHLRPTGRARGGGAGAGGVGGGEGGLRRSLALQDDYRFWAAHGESCDSGKLLIVETAAAADARAPHRRLPRHLFFDDNIERDRAHIVDARDLRTGAALPFAGEGGTQGRHLVKVEPLDSILDEDYFVKALAEAEARLDARERK